MKQPFLRVLIIYLLDQHVSAVECHASHWMLQDPEKNNFKTLKTQIQIQGK